MNWRTKYLIVERSAHDRVYYVIVDKDASSSTRSSVNGTFYYYKAEAAAAASHIFRALQRQIDKVLLG